ncbi:Imm61 family immunity protein [Microterricola viridarii]|uniref:Imm61 family immunity protein n=1 Tax=Microterricola viridarii TaxID=412690 RepID=UPI0015607562|nr:Imm61 family immunity protein [Microterricola viridarii]
MNAAVTVREALSGLVEFAALGGWQWAEPHGAAFSFMTGDPDDVCTVEDSGYVIRKHERGMVSRPVIRAARLADIEKFLSFRYGNAVRRGRGLPALWLADAPDAELGAEQNGFSASGTPADTRVSWTEPSGRQEVVLTYRSAGEWARYARFSAQEIRDSFLNPAGSPIFIPLSR